jgi:hypothetical protein
MNHEKHVIPEEVFTSVNLLPKIFVRRNKIEYNNGFGLAKHVQHHQIFTSDSIDTAA